MTACKEHRIAGFGSTPSEDISAVKAVFAVNRHQGPAKAAGPKALIEAQEKIEILAQAVAQARGVKAADGASGFSSHRKCAAKEGLAAAVAWP